MTSGTEICLAIDLGASSGRVIAGLYDGQRLTLEEVHRFPNAPLEVDGSFRWDIERLFGDIKIGLRRACGRYGEAIVSAGVDTWGVDYGLLDEAGQLVDRPFAYRDDRTQGMEDEICRRVPREEVYGATGIQFMFFNTLLQLFSEVRSGRPALTKARRLLFTPDLINYWLTGRQVNERTIASTSQMYDPRSGTWATGLLERLGLPTRLLGEIVDPGTVLGTLSETVREEIGGPPFQVVAPGCHDTACAVAGVPAEGDGHVYLSSGTWSLMGIESPEPMTSEAALAHGFTNECGVFGRMRVLKNICGLWLIQECRRIWAEKGEDLDYDRLVQLAEEAEPFQAAIDPDYAGFATPGDMPERIRTFCEKTGQTPPASKGAIVRTVLESLALRYRSVLDTLEDLTGHRLDVLHIVGGGARNRLLNQFAANALNRRVVTGPVEATAAGNIIMQLIAVGSIRTLDEGRGIIRDSFDTEAYVPADTVVWEEAYARFTGLESKD